ncbi:MAG: protein translocase subunit SecD [Kiritimatiellia bacterium]
MKKHAWWNWILLVALVAASLSRVMPWHEKVRFGLDLRGGISFVVKVDEVKIEEDLLAAHEGPELSAEQLRIQISDALDGALDRSIEVLRNRLNLLGIEEPSIVKKSDRIEIQLPGIGEDRREEAEQLILSVGFLEFRMVHEDSFRLTERMLSEGLAPRGWQIVTVQGTRYYIPSGDVPAEQRDLAFREETGRFEIPSPRYELLMEQREIQGRVVYTPHFVHRTPVLRSTDLRNASLEFTNMNLPAVGIEFMSRGATRFGQITEQNEGRLLGIVIDGTLYSAPRINEPIYGGRAQITGNFSREEAVRLVNVLRSGALPTRVRIEEKRYVAPSLGQDSIASGMRSIIIGGVGVLLFMVVYYQLSGIVANAALVLNMLLLPLGMIVAAGFMSMGRGGGMTLPVLTLPGVAGILLTIGMAVDANVLIFERMREELKSGKRFWAAISAGYDRAFVTIMDANVTTLMTGVILFIFGSGPIRGFAVTLCGGILVSMYTSLVVTKLVFGTLAEYTPLKTLRMLSLFPNKTSVDFISKRKVAMALSLAVIVITGGLLVTRAVRAPGDVFGVDFTGGSATTFRFASVEGGGEPVAVDALRAELVAAGVGNSVIQYQRELDSPQVSTLQIKAGADTDPARRQAEIIRTVLAERFAGAGFEVIAMDEVGAEIGDELKRSAVWSIVLALAGIIIYISWRFEFGFALGAIAALVHDVLFTMGLYALFGRQISLPIVAALLTIVGYSVNDTIVVFDRIREDLKLIRGKDFLTICNLSINETLGRTVLTSLTTLITIVMLLIFGGGAIFDFALALCIGVLVGTYSSIFIATPVVLLWYRGRKPDFAVTDHQV